jgi:hypothetical protein
MHVVVVGNSASRGLSFFPMSAASLAHCVYRLWPLVVCCAPRRRKLACNYWVIAALCPLERLMGLRGGIQGHRGAGCSGFTAQAGKSSVPRTETPDM